MICVLIISGSPAIVEVVKYARDAYGLQLEWIRVEDIDSARERAGDPTDVLLVDLAVAGVDSDGRHRLREVADQHPLLRVVGVGSDRGHKLRRLAYDIGAVAYLTSESSVGEVRDALTPASGPRPQPGSEADPAEAGDGPSASVTTRGYWSGRAPAAAGWTWSDIAVFVPLALFLTHGTSDLVLPFLARLHVLPSPAPGTRASPLSDLAAQVIYDGVAILVVLGLVVWRRRAAVQNLGWRGFGLPWFGRVIPIAASAVLLASLLTVPSSLVFPHLTSGQCIGLQRDYGGAIMLAVVAVSLVAPPAEETVFRGFLYGWLRHRVPRGAAVMLSALLFAISHGSLVILLPLFAVGVVLAVTYELSGSIWPGVMVHGLFNLINVIPLVTGHC